MLVTTLPPEADDCETDAKLAAGRRNTAFPLLCPADGDLPDVMDTLRLRSLRRRVSPEADAGRRVPPEADADLAPPLGLARLCFRVIAPAYTHHADPTYHAVLEPVWIR